MAERGRGAEYVMLRWGALRLLLPQEEIATLEPEQDADMRSDHSGAVGAFQSLPVYALSEGLDGFVRQRAGRPICALFAVPGSDDFGLLCSEAALVAAAGLDIKPLPAAMHEPDSPLLGLALDQNGLLCLSSAAVLRRLVARLGGFRVVTSEAA